MIKVSVNPDEELVEKIREKIKDNKGFCACTIDFNNPDNVCMCKEFRDQIDKQIPGYCDCGLYCITIQN